MCTIIISNHHYKEFPLVIAANRDEDLSRPSEPVQILANEPHLIIGGKDKLKGGTWLAVNKNSLFIALTNQGTKNKNLESRGALVMDALKCKSLEELLSFIEELNPIKYNNFNLVFGNNKTVYIAHSYLLHSMVIRELPYGIHIINSDMKFTGKNSKIDFIHKKLDSIIDMPWLDYYKVLKKILSNTEFGIKIKANYDSRCTRSSAILAFSEKELVRYKFHDRDIKRSKKQPLAPRYNDYINLFNGKDIPGPDKKDDSINYIDLIINHDDEFVNELLK